MRGIRLDGAGQLLDSRSFVIDAGDSYDDIIAPAVGCETTSCLVVFSKNNDQILARRVSSGGTLMDASAIPVSGTSYTVSSPEIAFDGSNYLVAWAERRSNTEIIGSRVSTSGVVLDSGGLPISVGAGDQNAPALTWDGTNFIVAWTDGRHGTNREIFAARLNSNGSLLDPAGVPITAGVPDSSRPALASGGGHSLIVWEWNRPQTNEYEIRGARVDGSLTLLAPSPIEVSAGANRELSPAVATDGTNFMVVWRDLRADTQGDIWGARVGPTGALLDPAGIPIASGPAAQERPSIAWGGSHFLVVWQEAGATPASEIRSIRVSRSGTVDPSSTRVRISNSLNAPAVASSGSNFLVVWHEGGGTLGIEIKGARIDGNGSLLDATPFLISNAAENQYGPRAAWTGSNYLVVWRDYRNGFEDIYGTRVTGAGAALEPGGFPVSAAADRQFGPEVHCASSGCLVAWLDNRSQRTQIYGTRVTSAGLVSDPSGLPISTTGAIDHNYPRMAIAHDGNAFVVAWRDTRTDAAGDIYGARVPGAGPVQDPNGFVISNAHRFEANPALASTGGQKLFVAYNAFAQLPGMNALRVRARFIDTTNSAPSATPVTATTTEDTPVQITLAGTDPDSDSLTWTIVGTPSNGTVTLSGNQATFTPARDFNGTATFNFAVSDGQLSSAPATATIQVAPVNDAPSMGALADVTVPEDSSPQTVVVTGIAPGPTNESAQTLSLTVTSNHAGLFTALSIGNVSNGTAQLAFTPAPDASGVAVVTVTAADDAGTSNGGVASFSRSFTVTVSEVNDPPTLDPIPNPAPINEDDLGLRTVSLSGISAGPANEAQTVTVTASVNDLTLLEAPSVAYSRGSSGTVRYRPRPNASGAATLTVTVTDAGGSTLQRSFDVVVNPINDAPVAMDVNVTTPEDQPVPVTLSATDVEGSPLTFTILKGPSFGTLSGTGGNLTYTPAANYHGGDFFTWQASDGALSSATRSAFLTVQPVNDVPVARSDTLRVPARSSQLVVQANDPDGDKLTWQVETPPTQGSLSGTGPLFTYTPPANFLGTTSFTFTVFDGQVRSAPATITLEVGNGPPTVSISADTLTPKEGAVVRFTSTAK
ncbi:MAG: Ig-like domain-containing protein, partial [Myxococcaceae bacterium]